MPAPGYRKRTIILLLSLLLIRFWFGQTFELTGPEAFLWLKSHGEHLAESYWEAGPLVPWLVRLGTLFFGDTELGVRWLAAVIYASAGFVLFFLARHWFGARSAFWAVLLFAIVPMYAWTLSFMTEATASVGLMALAVLAYEGAVEKNFWFAWLGGTVVSGLALLVAGANVLWLAGLLLAFFLVPAYRSKLTYWPFYAMAFGSLLFFLPVVSWWSSAQVTDERLAKLFSFPTVTFSLSRGLSFIGNELVLLGPLFLVLLASLVKMHNERGRDKWGFLLWLPVPGLIWEHALAFLQPTEGYLLPALYFPWLILAGATLSGTWLKRTELMENPDKNQPFLKGVGILLMALTIAETALGLNPFYYYRNYAFQKVPPFNNAVSLFLDHSPEAWRELAREVQYLQKENGASLVIASNAQAASALSFYLPNNPAVYVVRENKEITQFDFWAPFWDSAAAGDSAIFVTQGDIPADLKKSFDGVVPATDEPLPEVVQTWRFYKCANFKDTPEGASSGPPRTTNDEPLPK